MPGRTEPSAQPFAHLQAQNAPLYRAILSTFVRAKQRFTVHLRPEDVLAELGAGTPAEAVTAALTQLAEWGNLRADPDTGRVTTVEDFHRARYLYQLSPEGHAAEQAIAVYSEAVARRGALQSVALSDIAAQLRALLVIAAEANPGDSGPGVPPDPAKTHLLLMSLVDRFTGLADNAQAFMASLRRTVDFADAEVDVFLAYKEQLISYIERFIADLANRGAEIAALAGQIEAAGVLPLLEMAARREATDAAPVDEADEHARRAATDAALAAWQQRWRGLRDWFVSADGGGRQSQARLLRAAAIGAIRQLLGTVTAINERRAGRSDRSADFRTLALWFAQAPDDESAHRLWHTAFGLSPARHLTTTESLASAEERPVASSTPWAEAPPLEISPRLRRTGSYERRGSPNRVVDRSEQRRLLADRAERQAAEVARARAALVTPGPITLSRLGELDSAEFRLFLHLLGDALAARRPDTDEVVTTTSDGTLLVRLARLADAPQVRIVTEDGVLTGPDHLIEITDLVPSSNLAAA
ncbi:TIGR02677 family protein [Micromonospora sp. WMMD1102]|uniref:TIGR02677 family protein n=1 Tax=Micromonospora sp. WMMD1102 TaxID=3016105 RepID=UPI0024156F56|nr:TIGR02677 family protein [Micromonospora sp. WMMD1102]MDG4785077.1 TIGR02677 family protein [Micromonospora sp. WMMD1102]